jgi:hypothetical protein
MTKEFKDIKSGYEKQIQELKLQLQETPVGIVEQPKIDPIE